MIPTEQLTDLYTWFDTARTWLLATPAKLYADFGLDYGYLRTASAIQVSARNVMSLDGSEGDLHVGVRYWADGSFHLDVHTWLSNGESYVTNHIITSTSTR